MAIANRFVVDLNVGRLAKWLRAMGYDTVFPRDSDDNDLVRIALREGRILVTRDAGFNLRRAARQGQMRVLQIVDDDLRRQLRQLVQDPWRSRHSWASSRFVWGWSIALPSAA